MYKGIVQVVVVAAEVKEQKEAGPKEPDTIIDVGGVAHFRTPSGNKALV